MNNFAIYILELIASSNKNYGIHHFTDGVAMTWLSFAEKKIVEKNLNRAIIIVGDNNYSSFAKRPIYSILKNSNSLAE